MFNLEPFFQKRPIAVNRQSHSLESLFPNTHFEYPTTSTESVQQEHDELKDAIETIRETAEADPRRLFLIDVDALERKEEREQAELNEYYRAHLANPGETAMALMPLQDTSEEGISERIKAMKETIALDEHNVIMTVEHLRDWIQRG